MGVVFYLLAALTLAGGLAAVLLRNTVHCALALTLAFAGLALLFLRLDAQFAGFAQILVYGHSGGLRHPAHPRLGNSHGGRLQPELVCGAGDCRRGVCRVRLGGA